MSCEQACFLLSSCGAFVQLSEGIVGSGGVLDCDPGRLGLSLVEVKLEVVVC